MAEKTNNMQSGENRLTLNLLTPDRKVATSIGVSKVILPTREGEVEILPNYQNFIGQLDNGRFAYKALDGTEAQGFIATGFYYVEGNVLNVMAETLELSKEISIERAAAAQKKAEQKLGSSESDFESFRKYELKLQRALIRQQLANRQ